MTRPARPRRPAPRSRFTLPSRFTLRPRFTLRLRLTLLYGGLLAVVALTLLVTSAIVLDRTLGALPQFPPGQTLLVRDAAGRQLTVSAADLAAALRAEARTDLLSVGGAAFAVVLLVAVGAGYVLAGRALQPVSGLTATARRLSTETLHERIALAGPDDEVKELADTFDGMLARLDAAFDSQRRFVANASHELRTPLAVVRTEVDVTLADADAPVAELRRMGEVVREASVRADRLVDALLVLARSQAQERIGLEVREPVELAALARSAVDAGRAEAAGRCLTVTVHAAPAATTGDPRLLDRLVGNLVENAVRHNVDGGWVEVRTGTAPGAGAVPAADAVAEGGDAAAVLVVANSGPTVAPDAVDELFAPFRRGGTARTAPGGAGLGLSIVRAVAAAHGGDATAVPGPAGGLQVTVRLPAAAVGR